MPVHIVGPTDNLPPAVQQYIAAETRRNDNDESKANILDTPVRVPKVSSGTRKTLKPQPGAEPVVPPVVPPVVDVQVVPTDSGRAVTGFQLVADCLRATANDMTVNPENTLARIADPTSNFNVLADLVVKLKKLRKDAEIILTRRKEETSFRDKIISSKEYEETTEQLNKKGDEIRVAFDNLVNELGAQSGLSNKDLDDSKLRAAAVFGATTLMDMYDGQAEGFYSSTTYDAAYIDKWKRDATAGFQQEATKRFRDLVYDKVARGMRAYFAAKGMGNVAMKAINYILDNPFMKSIYSLLGNLNKFSIFSGDPTFVLGATLLGGNKIKSARPGMDMARPIYNFITSIVDSTLSFITSIVFESFTAERAMDALLLFCHVTLQERLVLWMLKDGLISPEYIVFIRAGVQLAISLGSSLIRGVQYALSLPMAGSLILPMAGSLRRLDNRLSMPRPENLRFANPEVKIRGKMATDAMKNLREQMALYAKTQDNNFYVSKFNDWFLTLLTPRSVPYFTMQVLGAGLLSEIIFTYSRTAEGAAGSAAKDQTASSTESDTASNTESTTDTTDATNTTATKEEPKEMVVVTFQDNIRTIFSKTSRFTLDVNMLPGGNSPHQEQIDRVRGKVYSLIPGKPSVAGLENAVRAKGSSVTQDSWKSILANLLLLSEDGVLDESVSSYASDSHPNRVLWGARVLLANYTNSTAGDAGNILDYFIGDPLKCLFLEQRQSNLACKFVLQPAAKAGGATASFLGFNLEPFKQLARLFVKANQRDVRVSESDLRQLSAEARFQSAVKQILTLEPSLRQFTDLTPEQWIRASEEYPREFEGIAWEITADPASRTVQKIVTGAQLRIVAHAARLQAEVKRIAATQPDMLFDALSAYKDAVSDACDYTLWLQLPMPETSTGTYTLADTNFRESISESECPSENILQAVTAGEDWWKLRHDAEVFLQSLKLNVRTDSRLALVNVDDSMFTMDASLPFETLFERFCDMYSKNCHELLSIVAEERSLYSSSTLRSLARLAEDRPPSTIAPQYKSWLRAQANPEAPQPSQAGNAAQPDLETTSTALVSSKDRLAAQKRVESAAEALEHVKKKEGKADTKGQEKLGKELTRSADVFKDIENAVGLEPMKRWWPFSDSYRLSKNLSFEDTTKYLDGATRLRKTLAALSGDENLYLMISMPKNKALYEQLKEKCDALLPLLKTQQFNRRYDGISENLQKLVSFFYTEEKKFLDKPAEDIQNLLENLTQLKNQLTTVGSLNDAYTLQHKIPVAREYLNRILMVQKLAQPVQGSDIETIARTMQEKESIVKNLDRKLPLRYSGSQLDKLYRDAKKEFLSRLDEHVVDVKTFLHKKETESIADELTAAATQLESVLKENLSGNADATMTKETFESIKKGLESADAIFNDSVSKVHDLDAPGPDLLAEKDEAIESKIWHSMKDAIMTLVNAIDKGVQTLNPGSGLLPKHGASMYLPPMQDIAMQGASAVASVYLKDWLASLTWEAAFPALAAAANTTAAAIVSASPAVPASLARSMPLAGMSAVHQLRDDDDEATTIRPRL